MRAKRLRRLIERKASNANIMANAKQQTGKAHTKTVATSIIEQLAHAGADDLTQLETIVASQEAELAELVAERRKSIDALLALAKILSLKINGKPPRKKPVRKVKPMSGGKQDEGGESQGDGLAPAGAQRILDCIMSHGPGTPADIARKIGKTEQQINMCLAKSRHLFEVIEGGRITNR